MAAAMSSECTNNWKAADQTRARPQYLSIYTTVYLFVMQAKHAPSSSPFLETGVFCAVCRHGIHLGGCDMIKSGEL